jgi:dTMP kinase
VRRGRFISLEGGEGSGKTTQAALLAKALQRGGRSVLLTREPGGTPGADAIRALLLAGSAAWLPRTEALLHYAARAEHLTQRIVPALQSGVWVVCDRFADSTTAYQGFGQGIDRGWLDALQTLVVGDQVPDRTLILHLDPARAAERLRQRGLPPDRYERMSDDFHSRVARGFAAIAAEDPVRCRMIEADGSIVAVHQAVLAAVADLLIADGSGCG